MPYVTRRAAILNSVLFSLSRGRSAEDSRLSVEGYIFQQYARRQGKKLGDVLPEVIPMVRQAGFHNVELGRDFLTPELMGQTTALMRSTGLRMPSVYSGGVLHDAAQANQTITACLSLLKLCEPWGCRALVFNDDPKKTEKTDAELATEANQMNEMGRQLRENGFELRVHNHTPEMVNHAREWRYLLAHTDPELVSFCLDLDWVFAGGESPVGLLTEAGKRVREIHVRNQKNAVWLEDLEDGAIDYRPIADYLKNAQLQPLVVVELAYREATQVTRPLEKDLAISREYAERMFKLRA